MQFLESLKISNFKWKGKYNLSNSPSSLELHYHLIKKNRQIKRSSKKCATVLRQPSLYLIYSVVAANSKKKCCCLYLHCVVYWYCVYTGMCHASNKKAKIYYPNHCSRLFCSAPISVTLTLVPCKQSPHTHTCTCIHSHTGRLAGKQQYAIFHHAISSFTLHSCVSTNNKLIQMRDCVRSGGENNKQIAKETAI